MAAGMQTVLSKWTTVAGKDGGAAPDVNTCTGCVLTEAQEDATYREWGEIVLKSAIAGGVDALVAKSLGRNANGAFWTGAMLTFSAEVYTDYVRQSAFATGGFGNGGDAFPKTPSDLLAYGFNNFGKFMSKLGLWDEEGQPFSRFMDKYLPFGRPTSYLHDVWQYALSDLCVGGTACYSLMLPAYAVSAMAYTSPYYQDYLLWHGKKK